jgi:hypothetical protein
LGCKDRISRVKNPILPFILHNSLYNTLPARKNHVKRMITASGMLKVDIAELSTRQPGVIKLWNFASACFLLKNILPKLTIFAITNPSKEIK